MQKMSLVVLGVGVAGIAAASTLAVHYRSQGEIYRQRCEAAEAALRQTPAPPPPAVKTETVVVRVKEPEAAPTPAPVVVANDDTSLLKEHVRQLQVELAEKDAQVAALRQATNRPSFRSQDRRDRGFSMETLKETDPKAYEEMEKRRQEMQQAVQTAFARKSEYLNKQDTSTMAEDEKAQHDQMVQLLDETSKLTAMVQTTLPPDERREAMRAIRDNLTALEPLLTAQRNRDFYKLGLTAGYKEDQAADFVNYLNDVIETTTTRNLFPGFRGGGPPGGGAPGSGTTGGGGAVAGGATATTAGGQTESARTVRSR